MKKLIDAERVVALTEVTEEDLSAVAGGWQEQGPAPGGDGKGDGKGSGSVIYKTIQSWWRR